jgi:hypothetical protein
VLTAALFFRDGAAAWWRAHVLASKEDPSVPRIREWTEFSRTLKRIFTPVAEKEMARAKLYGLHQTGSVAAYTALFRELSFLVDDLGTAEAFTLYQRGLKASIAKDVKLRFPTTLEEMIVLAERLDAIIGASPRDPKVGATGESLGKRQWGRRVPTRSASLNAAGTSQEGADVAAVKRAPVNNGGKGKKSFDDSEERMRLFKESLCFLCKKPGHVARDCPTATSKNATRR